jgi:hypothetical protein
MGYLMTHINPDEVIERSRAYALACLPGYIDQAYLGLYRIVLDDETVAQAPLTMLRAMTPLIETDLGTILAPLLRKVMDKAIPPEGETATGEIYRLMQQAKEAEVNFRGFDMAYFELARISGSSTKTPAWRSEEDFNHIMKPIMHTGSYDQRYEFNFTAFIAHAIQFLIESDLELQQLRELPTHELKIFDPLEAYQVRFEDLFGVFLKALDLMWLVKQASVTA